MVFSPMKGVPSHALELKALYFTTLHCPQYLSRRPETAPIRRVEAMLVEGSRRRGRPKLRWEDRLKQDMKELLLSEDMTSDRNAWRDRIRISG
ncbi:hypothetical protein Tco_0618816 [Tanacetum coccineum]